jgi:hypothetical protein
VLTVVFDAGPLITACKFETQGLETVKSRYRTGVIEHSLVQLEVK